LPHDHSLFEEESRLLVATHMLAAASLYTLSRTASLQPGTRAAAVPTVMLFAFGSHFVLDAVPHDELNMALNSAIGVVVILYVLWLAWTGRDALLAAAACLGAMPDVLSILHVSPSFNEFHRWNHYKPEGAIPASLMPIELAGALVLVILLYIGRRRK